MHTFCHASKCLIARQDQLFITCIARFRAACSRLLTFGGGNCSQMLEIRPSLNITLRTTFFVNVNHFPNVACTTWDRNISAQSSSIHKLNGHMCWGNPWGHPAWGFCGRPWQSVAISSISELNKHDVPSGNDFCYGKWPSK